jgi:hypothetical protein
MRMKIGPILKKIEPCRLPKPTKKISDLPGPVEFNSPTNPFLLLKQFFLLTKRSLLVWLNRKQLFSSFSIECLFQWTYEFFFIDGTIFSSLMETNNFSSFLMECSFFVRSSTKKQKKFWEKANCAHCAHFSEARMIVSSLISIFEHFQSIQNPKSTRNTKNFPFSSLRDFSWQEKCLVFGNCFISRRIKC